MSETRRAIAASETGPVEALELRATGVGHPTVDDGTLADRPRDRP